MGRDGWLGRAEQTFGEVGNHLEHLCLRCAQDAGVDGAGLAVFAGDGTPETVYATDDLSARIEDLQFTMGEGPCVDAARSGAPVLMPSLADLKHPPWPGFVRELAAAGVAALFAFPVQIGGLSLGTLDLYRRTAGQLSHEQLAQALRAVDGAAGLLLAVTADGLDGALPATTYRMIVHQAAGMAMIQLDTTLEQAMLRLRATAFAEDLPINDLATDLVSRRRRLLKEEA
jgi:hypothetical protein